MLSDIVLHQHEFLANSDEIDDKLFFVHVYSIYLELFDEKETEF